ncbi:MAG TPA: hypothetical protein VHK01_02035 [Lacipirellulaceae bacterium]|jgi:hypothetical protein|nr:hypothetical protein [Lacipirellulaceae bacterium]
MNQFYQRTCLLILIGLLATVAGCGSRQTYDVSGVAQYQDGSPISGAVRIIRLEPTDDTTATIRKAASGYLAEDGTFEMFTRRPGDGVIPGKYWVTFTVMDKAMGGKSLIPSKYTNAATSPFELVVDDDKDGLEYKLEKL